MTLSVEEKIREKISEALEEVRLHETILIEVDPLGAVHIETVQRPPLEDHTQPKLKLFEED